MRGALLLACLVLLIPAAAAQDLGSGYTMSVAPATVQPDTPLMPEIGTAEITVPWTIHCNSQSSAASARLSPVGTLVWEFKGPPTFPVIGPQSEEIELPDCVDAQTLDGESFFGVSANIDAPGETPVALAFHGRTAYGGLEPNTTPEVVSIVNVQADYLGIVKVDVANNMVEMESGQARFEILVTNLGNSLSHIDFDTPEPTDGFTLPGQITLESEFQDGVATTHTVFATFDGPSECGEWPLQIIVTPKSTVDADKQGMEVHIPVLAMNKSGCLKSTPAPAIAFSLVLVGLAAVTRRR